MPEMVPVLENDAGAGAVAMVCRYELSTWPFTVGPPPATAAAVLVLPPVVLDV
jgi:hypothetical protein